MLICNLKIVYIEDFYIFQHFLGKAFIFLVIGNSPSFVRFHSQIVSEIELKRKKQKKELVLEAICKRDGDSV